jgi:hypothetical protein
MVMLRASGRKNPAIRESPNEQEEMRLADLRRSAVDHHTCRRAGAIRAHPASGGRSGQRPQPAATDSGVGDIIVTAQRRSENLQKVPIVVTALNNTQLTRSGVVSLPTLSLVAPGLNSRTSGGGVFQPSIRGIGTSSNVVENPVALYIDGVYLANQNESNRELPDVEQIAVLKGPQGTLFGRNSTAWRDPDHHQAPDAGVWRAGQGRDRQLRHLAHRRLCDRWRRQGSGGQHVRRLRHARARLGHQSGDRP